MTDFELHLRCASLRGHTSHGWQGCLCEPGPAWPGVDVSQEKSLCTLCARGLAGGPSRWSWHGCSPCMVWEKAVRDRLGRMLLPLGRHSIMNGVRIPIDPLPDAADVLEQALLDQFTGWDDLASWKEMEVHRLAASADLHGETVAYAEWEELFPVSLRASRDAYLRLRGVDPGWVFRTFPNLAQQSDPPEPAWEPREVDQPAAGEQVRISPGPDGHDVTLTASETDWYTARCDHPGCGWSSRSTAFPLARWHANRHATQGRPS
jgi:hypothetical protein